MITRLFWGLFRLAWVFLSCSYLLFYVAYATASNPWLLVAYGSLSVLWLWSGVRLVMGIAGYVSIRSSVVKRVREERANGRTDNNGNRG